MEYRYPHFNSQHLIEAIAFRGESEPGQPMPDFDLPTTEGSRIRKRDLIGKKPLLLTCGSLT